MRWLVDWSNQSQFLALLVGELSIILSALRFSNFRVDAFPDSVSPLKKIRTETLGRSVPEVEDLITRNLEELLSGASWLPAIRSKSVPGLSSVVILCGLVTSTLFNLFVVPTLYQSFGATLSRKCGSRTRQ